MQMAAEKRTCKVESILKCAAMRDKKCDNFVHQFRIYSRLLLIDLKIHPLLLLKFNRFTNLNFKLKSGFCCSSLVFKLILEPALLAPTRIFPCFYSFHTTITIIIILLSCSWLACGLAISSSRVTMSCPLFLCLSIFPI